jgi:hypothetical protein
MQQCILIPGRSDHQQEKNPHQKLEIISEMVTRILDVCSQVFGS